MAGEDGWCCRSPQAVAVILLLFSLAQSLTCFSLRGLSKNAQQDKVVDEVAVRTGTILFNGKELNSASGSASAAYPTNNGLPQSEGAELFAQAPQLKEVMANEAAWRRLDPTLHCGQTKMKFRAMGPGAAGLQLDIGNELPLPLVQLPETCGYLMQQNAFGLVLVVPYDGCNVVQENGDYVVPMRWLDTAVKLTCPILQSPDATTPKPQHARNHALPHRSWNSYRHKRHAIHPLSMYDPSSLYYAQLYYYYMYMSQALAHAPPATAPPATTAMPDTTTTLKPPTYPPYMNYPYYYYYYYYNYPQVGQIPANNSVYYYPIIQHYHGRPQNPSEPMATTLQPPASTTKPGDTAQPSCTAKPTAAPTRKPTTLSTAKPTTASTASKTTKACSRTTPTTTSGVYPGTMKPFVQYYALPFTPFVSFKNNKAAKLPDYQKYMPQDGYKSGLQAHPYPYPNINWQDVPWFPHSPGQAIPQIDWKHFQLKQV